MTYAELIENNMALGFSDETEMQEFMDNKVLPTAINRAISEINLDVPGSAPRNEQYDFSMEEDETLYIDMEDIDDTFMEFANTPMLYDPDGSGQYTVFNDLDIINESTIVMESGYTGDFRVLYKVDHEPFDGTEAQLREDIPLARKVHHLVPLLTAYYVWLEDEPQKAAQYYNKYTETLSKMEEKSQSNRPRMRVLPGGI